MASPELDLEIADFVKTFYDDPLGFVRACYPWGEPGPLEHESGPDTWQVEELTWIGQQVKKNQFDGTNPVPAIREAISSGHGTGKSAMCGWIVDWIMSTRPYARGTITATTNWQLSTRTWPAIQFWTSLCLTGHWFTVTSELMYHTSNRAGWQCGPQSSDNANSFQGQHAKNSTSFYLMDEASGVADPIFVAAEGGLTDGEPMIFQFGNCTMSSGTFYESVFGRLRHRWHGTVIDSRNSRFTNKDQIAEWAQDFGEDSDFFRVRVRGLPPNASDAQFIDQLRVKEAQKRQVVVFPDEPLVAGVDLAWGGGDDNVIRFRRGADARSIPPIRVKGEFTRDPQVLTNRLADVMTQAYAGTRVHTLFLDSAGIAGPIGARLRQLGFRNIQEVNFGAQSSDTQCRFMRDFMWQRMKEWLLTGAIDTDPQLEADLVGPGIRPDMQQRVWLEDKKSMKARGLDSPDDADALALTFAAPVRAESARPRQHTNYGPVSTHWAG